jgi:hypothetical protein
MPNTRASCLVVSQRLGQRAILIHAAHDITPADELAVDVELRDGWPVRDGERGGTHSHITEQRTMICESSWPSRAAGSAPVAKLLDARAQFFVFQHVVRPVIFHTLHLQNLDHHVAETALRCGRDPLHVQHHLLLLDLLQPRRRRSSTPASGVRVGAYKWRRCACTHPQVRQWPPHTRPTHARTMCSSSSSCCSCARGGQRALGVGGQAAHLSNLRLDVVLRHHLADRCEVVVLDAEGT